MTARSIWSIIQLPFQLRVFEKISEAEIPSSIKKTASFQQFLLSVHFIKLDSEKETVKCKSQLKYFQSSFDKGNMTVVQNWVFLVKTEKWT